MDFGVSIALPGLRAGHPSLPRYAFDEEGTRIAYLILSSVLYGLFAFFFFSSRRRHTRSLRDWSSACALPIWAGRHAVQPARQLAPAAHPGRLHRRAPDRAAHRAVASPGRARAARGAARGPRAG